MFALSQSDSWQKLSFDDHLGREFVCGSEGNLRSAATRAGGA